MRSYNCYVSYKDKDTLKNISNTACWAGIHECFLYEYVNYTYKSIKPITNKKYIYINNFIEKDTEKYVKNLISLINEITPCRIIKINNTKYIKFKLLNTYDQSLILLNFIRNLWSSVNNVYSSKNIYNIEFFEILNQENIKYKDPLEKLTYANIEACKKASINSAIGHSNANIWQNLKIKNVKQLLEYKGTSVSLFLTQI